MIGVVREFNRTELSWKNPRGGWARFFVPIFLLAWLGGWTMGEVSAGRQVLRDLSNGTPNFFLMFWLTGWSFGGAAAFYALFMMVRPTRPETLSLDSFGLKFRRGTPPYEGFNRDRNRDENEPRSFNWRKFRGRYELPKSEIGEIRLERVGERQRLTVDHGAERIEIGRFLEEPDREWLHEFLKNWKGGF